MRCLVVDDEPLARQILEDYIERVDELEWVGSCANAIDTFSAIQKTKIDLLFLDIQMPQITGLELIKSIKNPPVVILTTAYRDYAFEAFDLDVVDYLLKPISFDRFLRSISKVYQLKDVYLNHFPEDGKSDEPQTDAYMYFREKREMVKVFLNDILYFESLRDYIRIYTKEKQIITYQKISYLEQKLPENQFIRVHRSFIVPIERISSYTMNSLNVDGKEIPIGRKYKNETIKILQKSQLEG